MILGAGDLQMQSNILHGLALYQVQGGDSPRAQQVQQLLGSFSVQVLAAGTVMGCNVIC